MNFKENLKKLRKLKGFSQEKLAEMVNLTIFTIQSYEQGKSKPNIDQLERIKITLNCSWEDLLD